MIDKRRPWGMSDLGELVALWRTGTYDKGQNTYSKVFLAGSICEGLGRYRRAAEVSRSLPREIRVGLRDAETLLAEDPTLVETALESFLPEFLEHWEQLVREYKKRECVDVLEEVSDFIYDIDAVILALLVISRSSHSKQHRERISDLVGNTRKAVLRLRRQALFCMNAAPWVSDLVLWEVFGVGARILRAKPNAR